MKHDTTALYFLLFIFLVSTVSIREVVIEEEEERINTRKNPLRLRVFPSGPQEVIEEKLAFVLIDFLGPHWSQPSNVFEMHSHSGGVIYRQSLRRNVELSERISNHPSTSYGSLRFQRQSSPMKIQTGLVSLSPARLYFTRHENNYTSKLQTSPVLTWASK